LSLSGAFPAVAKFWKPSRFPVKLFTSVAFLSRSYGVTAFRPCLVAVASALFLVACAAEPDCDLVKRRDFPSPGGKHTAVVFDMNCYNTTGFYPHVSVLRSGQKLSKSGNIIGAGVEDSFRVIWTSTTNLTVECSWRDRPIPQDKMVEGISVRFISRAPREDAYFARCLTLAREFLRTNSIASELDDRSVKRRSVVVDPDTGFYTLAMSVGERFDVEFGEHAGTNLVEGFTDREEMRVAFGEEGKAAAIAGTNLMSEGAALSLAHYMFRRQGHREQDFHPVQVKLMTTEAGVLGKAEILPCYVVTWIPRKVKLPPTDDSPAVAVVVSGIHSNVIAYANRVQ
jgi:hypothetical protein